MADRGAGIVLRRHSEIRHEYTNAWRRDSRRPHQRVCKASGARYDNLVARYQHHVLEPLARDRAGKIQHAAFAAADQNDAIHRRVRPDATRSAKRRGKITFRGEVAAVLCELSARFRIAVIYENPTWIEYGAGDAYLNRCPLLNLDADLRRIGAE